MKKWHSKAFVMADSILALLIVTVGVLSFATCQHQLYLQQNRHFERLVAARMAKESSDQLRQNKKKAIIVRGGYRAVADQGEVRVWYHQRQIICVRP